MRELLFLFNVYFPPLLNLDLLTDKGEVLSLFIPVPNKRSSSKEAAIFVSSSAHA